MFWRSLKMSVDDISRWCPAGDFGTRYGGSEGIWPVLHLWDAACVSHTPHAGGQGPRRQDQPEACPHWTRVSVSWHRLFSFDCSAVELEWSVCRNLKSFVSVLWLWVWCVHSQVFHSALEMLLYCHTYCAVTQKKINKSAKFETIKAFLLPSCQHQKGFLSKCTVLTDLL